MSPALPLPHHLYVWVDRRFIRKDGAGYEPAVWFALRAEPGRMWGCHVLLECGAVYRDLPPHALSFSPAPGIISWGPKDAQLWDCYGRTFGLVRYDYLSTLDGRARIRGNDFEVSYLFTAVPYGDGFSQAPEQSKEFMFLRTGFGRLTIQPTNRVLFREASFTTGEEWPTDLIPQTETYSCED